LIIAAMGASADAANVGWRRGNCPKVGSIKTKFTEDEI